MTQFSVAVVFLTVLPRQLKHGPIFMQRFKNATVHKYCTTVHKNKVSLTDLYDKQLLLLTGYDQSILQQSCLHLLCKKVAL